MKFITLKTKMFVFAIGALLSVSSARADFGGGRCFEATQQLASAQAGLQQATAILGQVQNICGGAIACIITAQNAYNQAVQSVQQAERQKEFACGCQEAIFRTNEAQNAFNQAQAILFQVQNICGGAIACILTAQNGYNQAKSNLDSAQIEQARRCGGGHHGGGHRPGPFGGFGRE